jgi:hypothetical protein
MLELSSLHIVEWTMEKILPSKAGCIVFYANCVILKEST